MQPHGDRGSRVSRPWALEKRRVRSSHGIASWGDAGGVGSLPQLLPMGVLWDLWDWGDQGLLPSPSFSLAKAEAVGFPDGSTFSGLNFWPPELLGRGEFTP